MGMMPFRSVNLSSYRLALSLTYTDRVALFKLQVSSCQHLTAVRRSYILKGIFHVARDRIV
jgi:hypothetical protein